MSEILFKRITIENFLSIGEGSIELDNRGLLLIQGVNNDDPSANSNGAGKSSTVDALCWVLYGTTARGKSGDGVVNRFEGKNCRVEITFTLEGKTYTVTRHRKHSKGKNRLLFSCDGSDLTLGTDKLTQDAIEKTIGCNLQVFTASIYAGQNNMPNLPAMTDKELKQLVEKAAGIELLDAAYEIARERLRAETAQRDLRRSDVQHLATQAETSKHNLEQFRKNEAEWVDRQQERIQAAQKHLVSLITEARDLREEIERDDIVALDVKIEVLERDLRAANKPLPVIEAPELLLAPVAVTRTKEYLQAASDVTNAQMTLRASDEKLRSLVADVRNLDAIVGTPCGECGKPYHEGDLKARRKILMEQVRVEKENFQTLTEKVRVLREALTEHERLEGLAVEQYERELARVEAANQAARETYQSALQARRAAIASSDSTKIMDALKSAQLERQRVSDKEHALKTKLVTLRDKKEQLEALKAEENPHTPTVAMGANKLARDIVDLSKMSLELDQVEARWGEVSMVADLFSPKGMRGEVLDSVTPFLNSRTALYLGTLSDGSITAEWKTVGETAKGEFREKFHIAVQNMHGSEDFEGLSGGEQRKVRISTAMALQDLVASRADRPIKLFIADEADDALDLSGLERLMSILEGKSRNVGTVLVISHNDLESWIPQQITVMKTGGKSSILEL